MITIYQKEGSRDPHRVKNTVVDGDGNLVVTIVKYSWLTCLFHSFYSFLLLALLVGVVLSVVEQVVDCCCRSIRFRYLYMDADMGGCK